MSPAHVALAAAAALIVCACAEKPINTTSSKYIANMDHKVREYENAGLPTGCLYDGRWHDDGAKVLTREDCLHCVCVHGALSCRRRACATLPDPLPRRCHVRHRRGSCCPELHCPDGVKDMEHGASARFESNSLAEPETPTSISNACVEGGTVFAAGSAMGSRVACEQCFCLRGARRCVRPRCLPPPSHCAPRPAPGACCPQRYYCDRNQNEPTHHHQLLDCQVGDEWVSEGASVKGNGNCTACFCLRGEVRCQAMGCAPPLSGCRPLLAPGECCAHQYVCDHDQQVSPTLPTLTKSSMTYDERAFHSSQLGKIESTTKKILASVYTIKHTSIAAATKNHLITTTKVKRKTDEPPLSSSKKPKQNTTNNIYTNITTTIKPSSAAKRMETLETTTSTEVITERTTEQPEGTVKIMINGTINCTAELSSTSLPLSIPLNDTDRIQMEAMPRIPIVNVEAQTYSPNDIITDRNVNGGFDENETFTINVTSSLITNTSHSTSRPVITDSKIKVSADLIDALNTSKKKKGDYDYDYTDGHGPTLPPSLPNLKIIPFVAADAVVDDEPTKETLTYPILEREDKNPIYYTRADTKDTAFPTRREDTYHPKQYPVFISEKVESLGSHMSEEKAVTKVPTTSTTLALETPAVNLFSPPVETEGGFIPKGPGIIDEYYAVYPSTPSGPAVPHLTTSMQLGIYKSKCITQEGRHVMEGESITINCMQCTCTWVELSCAPRTCPVKPGCARLPLSEDSKDPCCGDIVCDARNDKNKTTTTSKHHEDVSLNKDSTNQITTEESATPTDINNAKLNDKSVQTTTTEALTSTTTEKTIPKLTTTSSFATVKESNTTAQEDEDEDEEEGFSFGSVLKLLLSNNYETTTATPKKTTAKPKFKQTLRPTTRIRSPSTLAPFIPLPPQVYVPHNAQNTVNRIDHLVLGEATAIKRTTLRPITNRTTKIPLQQTTTERRSEEEEEPVPFKSVSQEGPRPPNLFPAGLQVGPPGLVKLAGCNIYGRIYRVGRIIAELSTPCQECWCTELGVQCKPLTC